jgi:N-acetylglucosamine-6-sulfatase
VLRAVLTDRRVRVLVVVLAVAAGGLAIALAASGGPRAPGRVLSVSSSSSAPASRSRDRSTRPNVVFVLTDDLSMNLVRFMPHVLAMQRAGLTFNDYFVSDSLCCPSRASIFTGDFPHDTGIFSNFGAQGGFRAFYARGEEQRTFAVALQRAGYRTALMGKFLNGYLESPGHSADGQTAAGVPPTYVPPGWSGWDGAGWGYPEFNYWLNENGVLRWYGHQPTDYLTDVISRKGDQFIDQANQAGKPFFLELATFAPHSPYVPAPRFAKAYPGLKAPRPPSFDVLPTHAPEWLADHPPLTRRQIRTINSVFRRRVQSVLAVDQMIGSIEETLARDGISRNTYIFFSSDNGLHTGEYRLMPGKLTAFDTDIHVPLVVIGPGVPAGRTTGAMSENIDLAKTFTSIAGTKMPGDGHSLLTLLHGDHPADWRNATLIEHHGGRLSVLDPDYQQPASGNPTTYEAMRTHQFLYVEYADGEREFYDLRTDPFELHNLAGQLTHGQLAQLHAELARLRRCHGGVECWAAMHVHPPLAPISNTLSRPL